MVRQFNEVGARILLAKTCMVCGLLKPAEQFRKVLKKYHQPSCKPCQYKSSKRADKKANHASWSAAKNSREPWLHSDITHLQDCVDEKMSEREIALEMNRSISSIQNAKNRYNINRKE